MRYVALALLLALSVGCNHRDPARAFPPRPSFSVGYLDVYMSRKLESDRTTRRLVQQAVMVHLVAFRKDFGPQGLVKRKLYVYSLARVNGPLRTGTLGYVKGDEAHVVAGGNLTCPWLYSQLVNLHPKSRSANLPRFLIDAWQDAAVARVLALR